jgi:hypothetical protein
MISAAVIFFGSRPSIIAWSRSYSLANPTSVFSSLTTGRLPKPRSVITPIHNGDRAKPFEHHRRNLVGRCFRSSSLHIPLHEPCHRQTPKSGLRYIRTMLGHSHTILHSHSTVFMCKAGISHHEDRSKGLANPLPSDLSSEIIIIPYMRGIRASPSPCLRKFAIPARWITGQDATVHFAPFHTGCCLSFWTVNVGMNTGIFFPSTGGCRDCHQTELHMALDCCAITAIFACVFFHDRVRFLNYCIPSTARKRIQQK